MAAIAAMSAATLAYRKAVSNSRKRKDLPGWMFEFQARLPNLSRTDGGGEEPENEEEIDEYEEKKARNLAKRKKEEERKKAAEEAETMVGGLKDFVID